MDRPHDLSPDQTHKAAAPRSSSRLGSLLSAPVGVNWSAGRWACWDWLCRCSHGCGPRNRSDTVRGTLTFRKADCSLSRTCSGSQLLAVLEHRTIRNRFYMFGKCSDVTKAAFSCCSRRFLSATKNRLKRHAVLKVP